MPQVHQVHRMIWIRHDDDPMGNHYGEIAENFLADYGKEMPELPEGIDQRVYEPGVRHALMRGPDVIPGMEEFAPMPWPEGDEMLAACERLRAAQRERYRIENEKHADFIRQKAAESERMARKRMAKDIAEQMAEAGNHLDLVRAGQRPPGPPPMMK